MTNQELWKKMLEAWNALGNHFEPVVEQIVAESNLDSRGWGLLLAVLTFEPETTTPGHLLVRIPYTSAEYYLNRLRFLSEENYLSEVADGEFSLSLFGRKETNRFIKDVRAAMTKADPLPASSTRRLAHLLDRLVQSFLQVTPPPDTWSIRHSYQLMPAADPPMAYIEQAFSCLAAYRDDAHLAAWQAGGLSATALEVLTFLWREQADTLDGLVDHLAHRGHSRGVYSDSLAELRKRKFITGLKDALRITEEGKAFRDQVEADTDKYFYRPWKALSAVEKSELKDLLTRMAKGLK